MYHFIMKHLVLIAVGLLGWNIVVTGGSRMSDYGVALAATGGCSARTTLQNVDFKTSYLAFRESQKDMFAEPDCDDCIGIVDTVQDLFCEDRPRQDCGKSPLNWFDDDYKWERNVNLFVCSDGKQYRRCGTWSKNGCCPSGTQSQPPVDCGTKNGREDCESRI